MEDLAFIILKYAINNTTNKYWKNSYTSIRKIYPDVKILIIDDHSPFINKDKFETINCDIVISEIPAKAEVLPYYYLHRKKIAKKVIIIHDSVFINKKIDVTNTDTYRPLWKFKHKWDLDVDTSNFIKKLNYGDELLDFYYKKTKWDGIFGAMSIMTWDFIDKIDKKFNFLKVLLSCVENREHRMCFERILGCVCTYMGSRKEPVYGDIHNYLKSINKKWGINYKNFNQNRQKFKKFPIVKVWTLR